MKRTSAPPRPVIDRSREAVLSAVTSILIYRPEASLAEIAHLIGIGRTTLHRMFATREDLMAAVASDSIQHLSVVYASVGIAEAFSPGTSIERSWNAFSLLADELVPLGPQLMFVLRASELDADDGLAQKVSALDSIFEAAIMRAQVTGEISSRGPAAWVMESLYALTYLAWEQIRDGKLASRQAASLIVASWRHGIVGDP